ncbi:MAG: hypothetical protein KJO70_04845 [Gammaproteobacteria bacterium]|nr:hypothetical protein [Gammaproteobacteria bacterium]MBT8050500.1 hypothetical protein [Gammaproteobacteria bacterium]
MTTTAFLLPPARRIQKAFFIEKNGTGIATFVAPAIEKNGTGISPGWAA